MLYRCMNQGLVALVAMLSIARPCFCLTDTLHAEPGAGTGPIQWVAQGASFGDDLAAVGGTASSYIGRSPNQRLFVPVSNPVYTGPLSVYSVQVRVLCRSTVDLRGTYDGIRVAVNIGGTSFSDRAIDEVGLGYGFYEHVWQKNPSTNAPWTWADISVLEAGALTAKSQRPTDMIAYVDYVEVVVAYGPSENSPPVASAVSASGTARIGETVTGAYTYSDPDMDPEGTSIYRWYRADDTLGTNEAALSEETTMTCVLPVSTLDKYVFFEVTPVAASGAPTGAATRSRALGPVVASGGAAPIAENVFIDGIDTVGATLTGRYTYRDPDSDLEGVSTFRWVRNGYSIPGAISNTYTLTLGDVGAYVAFEVTPVAATGKPQVGLPVASDPRGPISAPAGAAPQAGNVRITGADTVGRTLTAYYLYSDDDGDPEGASIFTWLRNGSPIAGATAKTYTLVAVDEGAIMTLVVVPVSLSGTPNRGVAVTSPARGPVGAAVGSAPVVAAVQITGQAVPGNTLTGTYSYSDPDGDIEGTSLYRWLRNGTPIAGATGRTYRLVTADAGAAITFEVTPVSVTGSPKTGTPVTSASVAVAGAVGAVEPAIVRAPLVRRDIQVTTILGRRVGSGAPQRAAGVYLVKKQTGRLQAAVKKEP